MKKGSHFSEETRKKMSEAKKGKPSPNKGKTIPMEDRRYGWKHTEESKRKMSQNRRGKPSPKKGIPLPEEVKQKISRTLTGRPSPNKGKTFSKERREKISGSNSPHWRGGKGKRSGYVYITIPDHPNADERGRVLEHIAVMAKKLGRALLPNETVHHKNGIKDDNRIDNLELRIGRHGKGQSVEDRIKDAEEILKLYAPQKLRGQDLEKTQEV